MIFLISVSTSWRGGRSSGAAGSAAILRQIIPIISLGQRAALSALLLRANCQPDTLPIPPIRENLGVSLRMCVRSRWLSMYAHTQRKTGNAPYVSRTRTFENALFSAACKKKRWKLWQKERGPDGASPLDRSRYADFCFMPAHPSGVKAAMPEGTSSPARRCS